MPLPRAAASGAGRRLAQRVDRLRRGRCGRGSARSPPAPRARRPPPPPARGAGAAPVPGRSRTPDRGPRSSVFVPDSVSGPGFSARTRSTSKAASRRASASGSTEKPISPASARSSSAAVCGTHSEAGSTRCPARLGRSRPPSPGRSLRVRESACCAVVAFRSTTVSIPAVLAVSPVSLTCQRIRPLPVASQRGLPILILRLIRHNVSTRQSADSCLRKIGVPALFRPQARVPGGRRGQMSEGSLGCAPPSLTARASSTPTTACA